MGARPNGNGNGSGGRRNDGHGGSVPRWVRGLFDHHERLLARMKAEHEERMAAHEEMMAAHRQRMDKMDDDLKIYRNEELETRRQTREIVRLVGVMEKNQERIAASLSKIHGRVEHLEKR